MHRISRVFLHLALVLASIATILSPAAPANEPIWSKKAKSFPARCFSDDTRPCKALKIISPDRQSFVQVSFEPNRSTGDLLASVSVFSHGRNLGPAGLAGFVEDEIAWSPDSKAFFITGNNNANTEYHVLVYLLRDSGLTVIDSWQNALRDMIRTFPPCKASNPYEKCQDIVNHPSDWIGIAGIDWVNGSSSIVVMLEMNESSIVGGILGQALGYQLEIPTGKILRRMEAKEFARRWQSSMAWKFRVPDPPEYTRQQNGEAIPR